MQYKKLIQSEIDFIKTFRLIAQAYEEIAVMKMRKVRASVLQAREYFTKLSDVFFEVKRAYKKQQEPSFTEVSSFAKASKDTSTDKDKSLQEKLKQKGKPLLKIKPEKDTYEKLSKTVSVFLSANTTLYGDLIARIFKLFLQNIEKKDTDVIVIGRLGRRLYEELEKKKPYLYFELTDFEVSLDNLKPVIYHILKYKTVMVYYGKFESIVNQQAAASNISGDQPFGQKKEISYKKLESSSITNNQSPVTNFQKSEGSSSLGTKFLFEPSLEVILAFFEDLITSSLFRQTVFETQLARWASRIMAMEIAQVNIETQIKRLNFLDTKINRLDQQKKQLERLSGISLWRR